MNIKMKLMLLVFLALGIPVQAQFLKQLGDKVQKAAENAVTNKSAEKTTKMTNKAMEGLFNMDLSKAVQPVDPSTLPAGYHFDWRYTLQMETGKGDMNLHYFLNEKQGMPFGSRPEMQQGNAMGNMLMVMDPSQSTITILMDDGNNKTGMVMSSADISGEVDTKKDRSDYEFKKIGTKEILGYTCQGFEMENEDSHMTVYVAQDVPVSINNLYGGNNAKQLPKSFDPKWLDEIGENSLIMEMDYKNKKKKGESVKMTCIALEKEPKDIDLSEYQFALMSGKGQ